MRVDLARSSNSMINVCSGWLEGWDEGVSVNGSVNVGLTALSTMNGLLYLLRYGTGGMNLFQATRSCLLDPSDGFKYKMETFSFCFCSNSLLYLPTYLLACLPFGSFNSIFYTKIPLVPAFCVMTGWVWSWVWAGEVVVGLSTWLSTLEK
jgi:hypothetical protein